jgi:UDP:flavonoid glycosyltransferase YjiC (YdhE family)
VTALGTLPVRALVTTGSVELRQEPPANVHVAAYVPHARVLAQADIVVTHAGLGTVHAALAHGVPLVCLPMARDQPDNAARVVWHGAGLRLTSKSSPSAIRTAVATVLRERTFLASAQRLAAEMADERPAETAPRALEAVAAGSGSTIRDAERRAAVPEVVSAGERLVRR